MRTKHRFVVTVEAETREQARQVMSERIGHDEWYGFDYQIDWVEVLAPIDMPEFHIEELRKQ